MYGLDYYFWFYIGLFFLGIFSFLFLLLVRFLSSYRRDIYKDIDFGSLYVHIKTAKKDQVQEYYLRFLHDFYQVPSRNSQHKDWVGCIQELFNFFSYQGADFLSLAKKLFDWNLDYQKQIQELVGLSYSEVREALMNEDFTALEHQK